MMLMNKKMSHEIASIQTVGKVLPFELEGILATGFSRRNECILLAALIERAKVSLNDFSDKTGYECFVNSLHIDDYVQTDFLAYACLFSEHILKSWKLFEANEVGVIIVSSEELGAVVKLHTSRRGETWASSNLEAYQQAVLVADSNTTSLIQNT